MRECRWVLAGTACLLALLVPSSAVALPPHFSDTAAFSGLVRPVAVDFASDGRVFVAEQSGLIKVFDGPADTDPTQVADLQTQTHTFWDRGLLGMKLDPQFPARPYLYVSYTYDAAIGASAPRWGSPGQSSDPCPSPPGPTADGCVVSGRLSQLTLNGDVMSDENVLINDWCQQYASHSVGDIAFGVDGSLFMSGGDGASFTFADYGQDGNPLNPCGDPPSGVGGSQTIPTAEGGALRSQDMRTSGDPLGLDGSLIRVNPDTGRPIPDMPGVTNQSTLNGGRIAAYGLRNPFRITVRPGTNEVWIGDVGWEGAEEIDRVPSGAIRNFGWPCYEGTAKGYDIGLNLCDDLYAEGSATAPYFSFDHGVKVDPTETCRTDLGSSISGLEFYETGSDPGSFPASYDNALFFTDFSRRCMWVMKAGTNGLPDPSRVEVFEETPGAVDLELGPGGALYYPAIDSGEIRRIIYEPNNVTPVARATASPDHGVAPLEVQFDASTSTDSDPGDQLSYAWDLDEDGGFDDSTAVSPTWIYAEEGAHQPRVRVSDQTGAYSEATVNVEVGLPPTATIDSPSQDASFAENQVFQFSGSATDATDGSIAANRLDWSAVLNHCMAGGGCHEHTMQNFTGVSGGELAMPAHERPYFVTLTLTARDSDGLESSTSVDLYPLPNAPPVPEIEMPAPDAGFSAGEHIAFSGGAGDREDGDLPAGALSWRLTCEGEGEGAGCGGASVVAPAVGDTGELVAPEGPTPQDLRLVLTATDSEGLSATTEVRLEPRVVSLLINSRRRGARVSIAGNRGRAPFDLTVLEGAAVRIATPARQNAPGHGGGAKLKWTRWSDHGERAHVVVPRQDRTIRVSYRLSHPDR